MSLNIAEFKDVNIFLSIPTYNCQISSNTMMGVLGLSALTRAFNIQMTVNMLHDSLVTRVRNRCADLFLASQCTHHLLIDSDIEFTPADVLKMLSLDKEFIAGPYPKKQINWKRLKSIVLNNPEVDPKELERLGGDFVINVVAKSDGGTSEIQLAELNQVTDAGTGFILLKRSVYEKMISSGEVQAYTPMNDENSYYGPKIYDFFRAEVDPETDNYLSEDYSFCRTWKKIGGEVWMAPWVRLSHWGISVYRGDLCGIAETGVGL